jgi:transposase
VDDGLTIAAVAATLSVAHGTVHRWLIDARIERRASPSADRSDLDDDHVRRRYVNDGCTAAEIATELRCGTSTIYARLAALGVPRRPSVPRRGARPDDRELRRRYETEGLSLRDIARPYGVSPQAVAGCLRQAGIQPRCANNQPLDIDPDALARQYRSGRTGPDLADTYRCSTATIYRRLDAAGVTRRAVTPTITRDQLVDALTEGMTATQVAQLHQVSVSAVCRALRREGLETARQAQRRQATARVLTLTSAPGQSAEPRDRPPTPGHR